MFTTALLPDTLAAIQLAGKIPVINEAYLAGGTALALHLGHRISVDLDFFTSHDFNEQELESELQKETDFILERIAWRTILGRIGETKFSLFFYQHPLIKSFSKYESIRIASQEDIAAMKIEAVMGRGSRRDFVDLYFLSKGFSLEEILEFYNQKYGLLEKNYYHILRSIGYFEDAEYRDDQMPRMIIDVDWNQVKQFFIQESIRLSKKGLGM